MSKGKRREREAAELYQQAGYETFSPQESKWGETDMFGLFDVFAAGRAPVRLCQVKSNAARGIRSWGKQANQFACRGVVVEMLVCHDREGWRLLHPVPGGHTATVDERDEDCSMGEKVVAYLTD